MTLGFERRRVLLVCSLLLSLGCSLHRPPRIGPLKRPSSLVLSHFFGERGTQLGQFQRPSGICLDVKGNVYVGDPGNRRISEFDRGGRAVSEYRVETEGFGEPRGLASDGFYVYVADAKRGEVVRVDPERRLCSAFSGPSRRISPWGIEATPLGDIYVSERENSQVLIFDGEGRLKGSFGRYGKGPGEFRRPAGIGVDQMRKVYVCDPERGEIEVFDPFGGYLFSLKTPEPPVDVDFDPYGNLWVLSPGKLSVLDGERLILSYEAPTLPGWMRVADGKLYLSDPDSNRVLVFDILYSSD